MENPGSGRFGIHALHWHPEIGVAVCLPSLVVELLQPCTDIFAFEQRALDRVRSFVQPPRDLRRCGVEVVNQPPLAEGATRSGHLKRPTTRRNDRRDTLGRLIHHHALDVAEGRFASGRDQFGGRLALALSH